MPVKLYYTPQSPACRATLLTVKALDVDVELVPVNTAAHEHLTPEFLKINPFHTLPTMQDGSLNAFDSHAINVYLVDKYGKEDSLYPQDLNQRTIVNQMLHFDSHVLSARLAVITTSITKDGVKAITKDKSDPVVQGLTLLETLLEGQQYVAGERLTIADFSMVATVSTINCLVSLASNRFPKIFEWWARLQQLPYYEEANQRGVDAFAAFVRRNNVLLRKTSLSSN